jgi:hypothetical protein
LEDSLSILEQEMKDLRNRYNENEYDLEKTRDKAFKLDRQLADTILKLQKSINNINNSNSTPTTAATSDQPNESKQLNGHGNTPQQQQQQQQRGNKSVNLTEKQVKFKLINTLIDESQRSISFKVGRIGG